MQKDQEKVEKWYKKHLEKLREGNHYLYLREIKLSKKSTGADTSLIQRFRGDAQKQKEIPALNLRDAISVAVEVFRICSGNENDIDILHEESLLVIHLRVKNFQFLQPHKIPKPIHWGFEKALRVHLHKKLKCN